MVTILTMLIYFPPFVSWAMDVEGNHAFQQYAEIFMAILCVFFDVMVIIKLKKSSKNKWAKDSAEVTKRKLEKVMLLQNIANLSVFIISFLPKLLSLFVPPFVSCQENYKRVVQLIFDAVDSNSFKNSIGHTLDGYVYKK
uniref:7TM GPCR serpentine receptor class x (Srx) domain-containing protein n=1 Tax=Acrobeloides nanus TaxID=290746 RepID=A0A914CHD1_9BILA